LNSYFLSIRIFEQLALALKTDFALKFFKTRGLPPPPRTPIQIYSATILRFTRLQYEINVNLTLQQISPFVVRYFKVAYLKNILKQ